MLRGLFDNKFEKYNINIFELFNKNYSHINFLAYKTELEKQLQKIKDNQKNFNMLNKPICTISNNLLEDDVRDLKKAILNGVHIDLEIIKTLQHSVSNSNFDVFFDFFNFSGSVNVSAKTFLIALSIKVNATD